MISGRDQSAEDVKDAIFTFERHRDWLLEKAAREYDLIVLDSLRGSHSYAENSNDDIQPVTRAMRAIALDTCFVIVHHTGHKNPEPYANRQGIDRLRGATDLNAARDSALMIEEGTYGGSLAIEVDHRNDAGFFIGVVTTADREKGTAAWAAVSEGSSSAEVVGDARGLSFLPTLQQCKTLADLPNMSELKRKFGDDYSRQVAKWRKEGKIDVLYRRGGGRPAKVIALPGQFPEAEKVPDSDL